jgi:antitoxin component YwqK of YwqJK toxin-antitoxin module
MNSLRHILLLLLAGICLVLPSDGSAGLSGSELNQIDERGQRQGYWIINGFMSNDRTYAPDETVEEGVYRDNRREGIWKKYWPGGKLRSQITYSAGRPQGAYTLYYSNGTLEEDGNWTDNRNTGAFRRNHPNGNPQQAFAFNESGKRNGIQRYYHENGKLALEVTLVNGKETGISRRYNELGQLTEEKTFENGSLVPGSIEVHKAAPVKKPAAVKDVYDSTVGKPSTAAIDQPNAADTFRPDGFNTLYNKAGDITQTGEFSKGRLQNGKQYTYNKDGILIRVEIYKNGRFIGNGVIQEAEL